MHLSCLACTIALASIIGPKGSSSSSTTPGRLLSREQQLVAHSGGGDENEDDDEEALYEKILQARAKAKREAHQQVSKAIPTSNSSTPSTVAASYEPNGPVGHSEDNYRTLPSNHKMVQEGSTVVVRVWL